VHLKSRSDGKSNALTKQTLRADRVECYINHVVSVRTPKPFNLHKWLPTGGFLQTAVSDAPRTTRRTYLRSVIGRIRYSTSSVFQYPSCRRLSTSSRTMNRSGYFPGGIVLPLKPTSQNRDVGHTHWRKYEIRATRRSHNERARASRLGPSVFWPVKPLPRRLRYTSSQPS